MKKAVLAALTSVLDPMLRNHVYTAKAGLVTGLKRRGGLGFIPKKSLTREHTFLKSLDFKGKNVYDIGGYIGLTTIFFARAVGETGSVVTFEPNPQNYNAILDHIELNGFKNVTVMQIGLGRKRETLKFVVSDRQSALGTAHPSRQNQLLERRGVRVFHIEVDTLDNQIAVNNLPKPDFVKIDVEGLEIDVLNGMIQTISNDKPELLIELHGQGEQDVVDFLFRHRYNVYQVENDINITRQNVNMVRGHLYAYGIVLDKHKGPIDFCEDIPYDNKDDHHDAVN
jgi:FkbM family methyltransferase